MILIATTPSHLTAVEDLIAATAAEATAARAAEAIAATAHTAAKAHTAARAPTAMERAATERVHTDHTAPLITPTSPTTLMTATPLDLMEDTIEKTNLIESLK